MKKMMTILAVAIGTAVAAQAASISWSTSAPQIYGPDGVTLAAPGWAVQLLYVGIDGAGTPLLPGDDAVAATKSIGEGIAKAINQPGNFAGANFDYTYGVTTVGGQTVDMGDAFIIRVFNNASAAAATEYLDVGGFTITATDDTGTDTFQISSPVGTTGWTPVPEPTSFALLGLGAAALALRRRLRK